MMASDEGNPSPPPAPVARLPKLPSNAEIVRPRNADVSGQRRVRSSPAAGATAIDRVYAAVRSDQRRRRLHDEGGG